MRARAALLRQKSLMPRKKAELQFGKVISNPHRNVGKEKTKALDEFERSQGGIVKKKANKQQVEDYASTEGPNEVTQKKLLPSQPIFPSDINGSLRDCCLASRLHQATKQGLVQSSYYTVS